MKPKILLAEDDLLLVDFLEEIISRLGYQIKTTSSGKNVLAMCQAEEFDVLILDMLFPDEDGINILRQLTKLPKKSNQIKILAISGGGCGDFLSADFLLQMAKKRGATKILHKPFSMAVFEKELKELIEK